MRISIWRKLLGSIIKLAFPAILLILLGTVGGAIWLVHLASAEPPRTAYLITPEKLTEFTKTGKRFTDETWSNQDS